MNDFNTEKAAYAAMFRTQLARPKNPAAVALGRIKSAKKAKSSKENGKLGGRPVTEKTK